MKKDYIHICGKTSQSKLPNHPSNYPCKEICKTFKLSIPDCKPDMKKILEIAINGEIKKTNILCSIKGKKLVIYGVVNIKILYIANTCYESVHSAHFQEPFCTFINLDKFHKYVENINIFIEDVFIEQINSKQCFVSTLALVYPIFNKKLNSCNIGEKEKLFYKNKSYDDLEEDKNITISNENYRGFNNVSYNNNNMRYNNNNGECINYDRDNSNNDLTYNMQSQKEINEDHHANSDEYLGSLNVEYDMNDKNNGDIKCRIEDDTNLDNPNEEEYFESEWE